MRIARVEELRAFRADKMAKVNLFDTPRMFCDIYGLEPGQEQKPHAHEGADKVYFVLEGEATVSVGGEEARLGPGAAVLAPSGEDHGVRNDGPERVVLLVFMAPNPNYG
jgi:mannose-6-phosphate isomerase-like protein (cupin superfamily)